jgi:hypothetical protein
VETSRLVFAVAEGALEVFDVHQCSKDSNGDAGFRRVDETRLNFTKLHDI